MLCTGSSYYLAPFFKPLSGLKFLHIYMLFFMPYETIFKVQH